MATNVPFGITDFCAFAALASLVQASFLPFVSRIANRVGDSVAPALNASAAKERMAQERIDFLIDIAFSNLRCIVSYEIEKLCV